MRRGVAGVYGSVHYSRPKPSDRGAWPDPKIPVNNAQARVGNGGAGQNRELRGRSEIYRLLWLGSSRRAKSECRTEEN